MKELVNVFMIDVEANKIMKDNVGFAMNFDDAIAHSLNATTKSMEKCKRRYNTILKKSTITKELKYPYETFTTSCDNSMIHVHLSMLFSWELSVNIKLHNLEFRSMG